MYKLIDVEWEDFYFSFSKSYRKKDWLGLLDRFADLSAQDNFKYNDIYCYFTHKLQRKLSREEKKSLKTGYKMGAMLGQNFYI